MENTEVTPRTIGPFSYVVYWPETGEITGSGQISAGFPDDWTPYIPDPGQVWAKVARIACIFTEMYVGDEIVPRPASPITREGSTLHNVPNPSRVIVALETSSTAETDVKCTDGEAEISFDVPGRVVVRIVPPFPIVESPFLVTVTADGPPLWSLMKADQNGFEYEDQA